MRRIAAAVAMVAVAGLLTGCAGAPGASVSDPRVSTSPGAAVDLLPTVWHVHDAVGAGDGTYLLFRSDEVEVLGPRGFVELGWATQGEAMITLVQGWSMSLGTNHPPTVPWLTSATRFARSGADWVLFDSSGRRVAVLSDDGPAPTSSTTLTTPDPVRSFDRQRTADAVAGRGARTVAPASLVGRWGVEGLDPAHASLTLAADGTWTVRGGCDSGTGDDLGGAGVWRVLSGGFLLQTAGAEAGVGCSPPATTPPADAAALIRFAEVRSVALDGDRLTVYDRAGKRIGTLTRLR